MLKLMINPKWNLKQVWNYLYVPCPPPFLILFSMVEYAFRRSIQLLVYMLHVVVVAVLPVGYSVL